MDKHTRKEFKLTDEQLKELYDAAKPVPYLVIGGIPPSSPQENVNHVWMRLGKELNFKWMSVRPISGKSDHYFTAEVKNVE